MVKYGINLAMGIFFVISFFTGLLKFTLLLRITGLNMVVLPSALISDVHDWSGIFLCLFVWLHLFLNRRWMISMTKNMLHGTSRDA
jgi:hypothetical protein